MSSCPDFLHSDPDSEGHKIKKASFTVQLNFLCLPTAMCFHFQHREKPSCKTTQRIWNQM